MPNRQVHSFGKVAVENLHEGMAPYLNEELNFYSPKFVRSIRPAPYLISHDEQYYWIVHAASSTMRVLCKEAEFVVGVIVVHQHAIELSVFTKHFELACQVNREGAVACYKMFACIAEDDVWVLKVEQEKFDE
jgi:hypothetical protein